MIEVVKQIEQDWYIIHLTGTTYYQIWNKNDLHETLLEARSVNALAATLRRESTKLKMLDYKENYKTEVEVMQKKKERIVGKHE
jgi:hypothetical protein